MVQYWSMTTWNNIEAWRHGAILKHERHGTILQYERHGTILYYWNINDLEQY